MLGGVLAMTTTHFTPTRPQVTLHPRPVIERVPRIEVTEMYLAPQGEGPNLGRQSLFLRLRRCTLQCAWCDSKHTWDRNDPEFYKFSEYEVPTLVNAMVEVASDPVWLRPVGLVITGGEPMIWQQYLPDIAARYRAEMREHGVYVKVEVETAGTIVPSEAMLGWDFHFNVSPKLWSSGNEQLGIPRDKLWNARATKRYLAYADAIFKPVVGADPRDQTDLVAWLNFLGRQSKDLGLDWREVQRRVYIMPEGQSPGAVQLNLRRAISIASATGTNVTTRMHITAHGNERRR